MNNVNFIVSQGNLNNASPNQDGISGLVFYSGTLPTGFSGQTIQEIFSIIDAVNLGVTPTLFPIENYTISEYFRINPNGTLYVCFSTGETFSGYTYTSGTTDYHEVSDTQSFAAGTIRQIGVLNLIHLILV